MDVSCVSSLSEIFRKKLLPWVGLNLVIGLLIPFIDNLGHFGGLIGGAVFAMVASNRIIPAESNRLGARVTMGVVSAVLLLGTGFSLLMSWIERIR